MSFQRAVVTGLGAISSLAGDKDRHFERLLDGASGIAPAENGLASLCPLAARPTGPDPRSALASRMLRKLLPPSAAYAVLAAGAALADAGLAGDAGVLAGCGLYVGSVYMDLPPGMFEPALRESLGADGRIDLARFATRGLHLLDPLFLVKTLPNAGLGGITIEHQVAGPNLNVTNGAVAGLQAVACAAAAIERGDVQVALAGGYDSQLGAESLAAHLLAGRLSSRSCPEAACRPFDLERDGYVPGEGACFLLLESSEHARRRGAPIHAEILGTFQTTVSPGLPQAARAAGLAAVAEEALREAETRPEEIDALFGDGLATEEEDLMETEAVQLSGSSSALFTAATAALGFTGAASGPFSLLHAVEGMRHGVVPPMIGCLRPDPRCDLRFAHRAEPVPLRRALVWNSDRGIKNVAVLLGTPEP